MIGRQFGVCASQPPNCTVMEPSAAAVPVRLLTE
jgi:hypothetical protein